MGCAAYHRLANEHELLSKKFSQIISDKESVYSDKIQLESEVALLKKNVYQALHETEKMKKEIDLHRSTEYPEIFESGYSDSTLISDWLEMDLRDGDRLLDALAAIAPSFIPDIEKLKARSSLLNKEESNLHDYLNYFVRRYDLFNSAWRELLSSQKQVENSVQHLKTELVNGIQSVESFLGKRGEAVNELMAEYRRTSDMQSSQFLVEQRLLMTKLNTIRKDMMNKKLEEKDAERHRVVSLLESEISKINHKHAIERENSEMEKKKMHEQHQTELQSMKHELHAFYDKKIASLQVPRTEIESAVRREYQQQIAELHERESIVRSRLCMLSEEMLAASVRHQSEKELIQSVLTDEIEQRVNEMKQMRDMNKHEKAIAALKHYEEISGLKKECESLKKELQGGSHSNLEEIQRLKSAFAEEESNMKKLHIAELEDRNKVLTELRNDFLAKSDSQKAFFDEKLSAERSKHALELQSAEDKIATLMREIHQKDALQQESALQPKNSESLQYQLISGLTAKIALIDVEFEARIRSVSETLFSEMESSDQSSPEEPMILALLAKVSRAETILSLMTEDEESVKEEASVALHSSQAKASRAIEELQRGGKELKRQLAYAIESKTDSEAMIADMRYQLEDQNQMMKDSEFTIEVLKRQLSELKQADNERKQAKAHDRSLSEFSFDQNDLVKRYIEDLSHRDAKIKELAESQRALEAEFLLLTRKRRLKTGVTRITTHVLTLKQTAFIVWKTRTGQYTKQLPPTIHSRNSSLSVLNRSSLPAQGSELDLLLAEDKRLLFEKTSLAGLFRAVSRTEAPMMSQQTFKLIEEVLERKFEADVGSMQKRRKPKAIPLFALEHLKKTIGNQKLAQKTLGQALICLLRHMRESQPYAELFCKLLNVGVSDPISVELGVFVVKTRFDFGKFVENYHREFPEKKSNVDLMGGSAFLVDVISYLYDLFEGDEQTGELVLKLIRPDSVQLDEYVLFKICHKMAKSGVNAEGTFEMMDTNLSGMLERSEFIDSIRKTLQLWISAVDIDSAFLRLSDGSSVLRKSVFLQKLNFKQYLTDALSEKFSVSRAKFLSAIVEVHSIREKQIASELLTKLGSESPLQYKQFVIVVKEMEENIEDRRLRALWHLAEELSLPSDVTPRSMVRVLLKHRILPYSLSPYCNPHLDESKFDPTVEPLIEEPEGDSSESLSEIEGISVRGESFLKELSDNRFSF